MHADPDHSERMHADTGRAENAEAERDRARDTARLLEAYLERVTAVRERWDQALTDRQCPSCHASYDPSHMPGCDHAEGYHHALSDLNTALRWTDPNPQTPPNSGR